MPEREGAGEKDVSAAADPNLVLISSDVDAAALSHRSALRGDMLSNLRQDTAAAGAEAPGHQILTQEARLLP